MAARGVCQTINATVFYTTRALHRPTGTGCCILTLPTGIDATPSPSTIAIRHRPHLEAHVSRENGPCLFGLSHQIRRLIMYVCQTITTPTHAYNTTSVG